MDSKKAYEQLKEEIVDRESAYLCTELERALDRIITWTDPLDDTMFRDHKFLMDLHKLFPALEKLEYDGDGDDFPEYFWDVEILPDVLESLGKVKKLSISRVVIIFHDPVENGHIKDAEEETSLEVFNKAFDIIDKKFPRESTEIELVDKENWFWIKKEKGNLL